MSRSELKRIINLDVTARFVPTRTLRMAYVRYAESLSPSAPPFVSLGDGLELGIVSSAVPEMAWAISSMLTCSLEEARNDRCLLYTSDAADE